jgi:putative ABC transport system substrate-binding protein
MLVTGDALAAGLVANLAQPGGNITGSSFIGNDLMAKRLELAKEMIPDMAEVAVLINPDNAVNESLLQAMSNRAGSMKIGTRSFEARRPNEFDATFSAMVKEHVEFIVINDDAVFLANDKAIAELASKYRIPSTGSMEYAEAGGLMGYGVNFLDMYRHGAYFVDRILKGAKPADLAVQQPTKFELAVNLKTAKALGLMIPQSILLRADEVIE